MFTNRKILLSFIFILLMTMSMSGVAIGAGEKAERLFAYVACEDRRIYKIDLENKAIMLKTDEIREMGKPTAIDIDLKQGKLYVASERGRWQEKYSPITVLDINSEPIRVINYFDLIVDVPIGAFVGVSAVYEVKVWPDGKKLLLGYSHPKYSGGMTVVDSSTGEVLSLLDFKIHLKEIEFSPDQTKIAKIWDKGIIVYDLVKHKQIFLKKGEEIFRNEIGLNPPWAKRVSPLYVITDNRYLRAINRGNGKILFEVDLEKITGGLNTFIKYPIIFDKDKKAIIPMIEKSLQGYVVVIDLETKEVIKKIEIGISPTNIVLSN